MPFPSPRHESEVSQSCLTLSDPMDCSLPGPSIHGIIQARVLEWGAIAFSNLHRSGTLFPARKTQRHCYIYPLRRNQDHTLYFLNHSSFVSHSLPYGISNCLNLPFGTQGWSGRLKPASKKQGAGKDFCTWKNSPGPALLQPHLFFDTLQPREEQLLDKTGNNDLD